MANVRKFYEFCLLSLLNPFRLGQQLYWKLSIKIISVDPFIGAELLYFKIITDFVIKILDLVKLAMYTLVSRELREQNGYTN